MPDESEIHKLIAEQLLEGKVVPVLGAGVNLCDRPADVSWELGRFLPSGRELADYLARPYPAIDGHELAEVAQYVAALAGGGHLYDKLHKVFAADYQSTRIHTFLARLSRYARTAGHGGLLLVTTNYDDLLERAFDDEGETYELVTYIADGRDTGHFRHVRTDGTVTVIKRPNKYEHLRLDHTPVIAKIHGAVDRRTRSDSFVVTEDHYTDYITRADVGTLFPVNLGMKLRTSHFLFLGYSLRDWNLRVMLYRLWAQQQGKDYKSWAVQPNPDRIEELAWGSRGVRILSARCEDFVTAIEVEVDRLRNDPPAEAS
jgi:hypothetical protein